MASLSLNTTQMRFTGIVSIRLFATAIVCRRNVMTSVKLICYDKVGMGFTEWSKTSISNDMKVQGHIETQCNFKSILLHRFIIQTGDFNLILITTSSKVRVLRNIYWRTSSWVPLRVTTVKWRGLKSGSKLTECFFCVYFQTHPQIHWLLKLERAYHVIVSRAISKLLSSQPIMISIY